MSLSDDEARLLAELEALHQAYARKEAARHEWQHAKRLVEDARHARDVARDRYLDAQADVADRRTRTAITSDLIRVRARNKGAA